MMLPKSALRVLAFCCFVAGVVAIPGPIPCSSLLGQGAPVCQIKLYGSLFSQTLMVLALFGVYAVQAAQAGWLGIAGLSSSVVGLMMFFGNAWMRAFVFPVVQRDAPELLSLYQHNPSPVAEATKGGFIVFTLGLILLALASHRARILPRAASWMLAAPLLSFLPMGFVLGQPLLGVALVWIGVVMWKGPLQTTVPLGHSLRTAPD